MRFSSGAHEATVMARYRRSKPALLAILLVFTTQTAPGVKAGVDDGSEEFFATSRIGDIWLDIPLSSWEAIDDESLSGCEPMFRSYHSGGARIGTNEFPGSGIRVKGGCGSSRTLDSKAAFKVNLSWDDPAVEGCAESRKYKGLKKITLNNQVEDASFTHERIGYDFFQKLGIPVPRAAPMRVHVNNELWGLYLNLETIDRRFLSRHFESKKGMLYEGDYGCDIGEEACFEEKFDTDACDGPREGYDPTDKSPLRDLHARLAELPGDDFYPAINQIFDFDTYLTTWAAAAVMGYWDGYPNDPTNYRIYHNPSDDRWTLIPSGIDQLFEKDVDPFKPVGLLSVRCLAEQDCQAAFRKRLAEVIDVFESSDYAAMARSIARQIGPDVESDPRKEITVDEWREAVDNTVQYIQRRPGELRAMLAGPAQEAKRQDFNFHALTDPQGERYVVVTWVAQSAGTDPQTRWFTAKGHFEGLQAEMDAVELAGASSAGVKIGKVIVGFVDCETAYFEFRPDDPGYSVQGRTERIDSNIWKYCE